MAYFPNRLSPVIILDVLSQAKCPLSISELTHKINLMYSPMTYPEQAVHRDTVSRFVKDLYLYYPSGIFSIACYKKRGAVFERVFPEDELPPAVYVGLERHMQALSQPHHPQPFSRQMQAAS
ncbi:MAG: hypothetical protein Q4D90_08965 [bacterium]|nr:hypothetical protein [bacterium]